MADKEENRFAHLLQPIRDLQANWHTDIAAELSDYLTQLEDITFSFDGGNTSLNFAEAALLIQGSTCVYSRKVEYLHKLVYNALEAVASKRRAAADGDAGDACEAEEEEDDVAAFLGLDDVLEEGQGIDLDDETAARCAVTPREPDSALWALCDAGNGAEVEGQAQYKIASCAVHFTGALLLDPRDAALLDEHLQYRVEVPAEPAAPAPEAAAPEADFDAGAVGGGWSDDDGRMDDLPGGDAFPADGVAGMAAQAGGPAPPVAFGQEEEEEEEEEADPWAPLDYNDAAGLPVKPFRKGRTQRREAAVAGTVAAAEARAACAARQAARLGALFPEFVYAYEERAKLRKRERVAAARAGVARGAMPAAAVLAAAEEEDDDFGGGDYGGGYGGGFSDDDALPPLDPEALAAAAAEGAAPPSWGNAAAAPPPQGSGDDMSYEDLVRAHIDRYLALAAASEGQTELAVRVASWKSKIEPALLEQEARPAFDIHACGATVLSALQEVAPAPDTPDAPPPPPVRFEALMAEREVFEVARSFAAMLQLVNAGNLDIVLLQNEDAARGPFAVQLLSTTAAQSALDAYRAPSLDDAPAKPVPKAAGRAVKGAPAAKRRAALAGGSQ